MIAAVVYVLCALTSLACTALLWRGYRRTGARLLLWSALCFAGFFLNNALLVVDFQIFPEHDLSVYRSLPSLMGISFLIYGLVADAR